MSNHEKHHIVSYKTYIYILLGLITLTLLSIAITSVELGTYAVFGALLLASIKSALVLTFFMHLKFDKKLYAIMVAMVLAIFAVVLVITYLDYGFR